VGMRRPVWGLDDGDDRRLDGYVGFAPIAHTATT
jgi:hypothetical protein